MTDSHETLPSSDDSTVAAIRDRVRAEYEAARRWVVLGAGLSGRGAAAMLLAAGRSVTLLDDRAPEAGTLAPLTAAGAEFIEGPFDSARAVELITGADALIASPGIGPDHPVRRAAASARVAEYSEIDLAQLNSSGCVIAITGTNGKSTVTRLTEHLCLAAGRDAVACGNIGHPYTTAVAERPDRDRSAIYVVEVSSFQLETSRYFSPDVAVILNVTPDHLDRHRTLTGYVAAKERITSLQTSEQTLVVNEDDPQCLAIAGRSRARIMGFSLHRAMEHGAWLDEDRLALALDGGKPKRIVDLDGVPMPGLHNVANTLAACCAAAAAGVGRKGFASAVGSFRALDHRTQRVGEINGVEYVNDSKATNIDALVRAIESYQTPIHLIAGGRDKDSPFASVRAQVAGRVARAYLIGEAAEEIRRAWSPDVETEMCGTLSAALERAAMRAVPGDVILLSPGCASFDQFKNYADRGNQFADWVTRRSKEAA